MHHIDENGLFQVNKIDFETPMQIELDQDESWIHEILDEVNAEAETDNEFLRAGTTSLNAQLTIEKVRSDSYGSTLTVCGEIKVNYAAQCVNSLKDMTEELSVRFKAASVDSRLKATLNLENEDDILVGHEQFELFYYTKNQADLKEMIREIIFLNLNPYPRIDDVLTPGNFSLKQ